MIKWIFVVFTLLFFEGGSFLADPAFGEIYNRVVAIVNDDVVTLYELNTRIREMTGKAPDSLKRKSESEFMNVRRKILQSLIEEKIAREKIKKLEIKIDPKDVDMAIERVKENNDLTQKDLVAELRAQGQTLEGYRRIIKRELERIRLINYEVKSKIIIREEEMKQYYDEHQNEFTSPGKVHLAMIFLKQTDPEDHRESQQLRGKTDDILKKLKAGEDFGVLAREYSDGPGARDGGDMGIFKISELNEEMAKTVNKLSSGEVGPPIVTPGGIQIIKVVEKDQGGGKSFEQAKNAIRSTLYREALNEKYAEWIKALREKAYTKIIF